MSPSLSSPFTLVTIYALWVSLSAEAIPRSSSCSLWGDPTRVAFFLHVCDPSANTSVTPSSPAQCSVESALRHNPDWEIWVLTNCWNRELFNQEPLKKSRFRYIRIEDLFGQIPLMKEWFDSGKWQQGYKYHHLSDALRLAVLQICGGLYLDSDIISVASLNELPRDFVGLESGEPEAQLNNAAIRATTAAGNAFITELIEDFVANFDAARFGWNGPQMVTRVVASLKQRRALDVSVVTSQAFYPVSWDKVHDLFADELSLGEVIGENAFGIHLWQSLVKAQLPFVLSHFEGSPIGQLYKHGCPFTLTRLNTGSIRSELSSFYPAVLGLRFKQPVAGQQFFGEDVEVPIELSLRTGAQGLGALDAALIRICLSMNGQLVQCVSTSAGPLMLQNVPTGHHLLTAQICLIEASCSKASRLNAKQDRQMCCFNGLEGVTSLTVNFHGVTVL